MTSQAHRPLIRLITLPHNPLLNARGVRTLADLSRTPPSGLDSDTDEVGWWFEIRQSILMWIRFLIKRDNRELWKDLMITSDHRLQAREASPERRDYSLEKLWHFQLRYHLRLSLTMLLFGGMGLPLMMGRCVSWMIRPMLPSWRM